MRQCKLTDQQRLDAVRAYLMGAGSYQTVAAQFGISARTLRDWVALYESQGEEALSILTTNTHYPPELKQQAVAAYINGEGSQRDICLKYQIRTRNQLREWVRKYDTEEPIILQTPAPKTPSSAHNVGRKTTLEERIDCVCFCLTNGRNYHLAADVYKVSYQQVYGWVQKYLARGVDGLRDGRGKAKNAALMTPMERLEAENKMLKAEIHQLQTENLALRKLRQRERRWG